MAKTLTKKAILLLIVLLAILFAAVALMNMPGANVMPQAEAAVPGAITKHSPAAEIIVKHWTYISPESMPEPVSADILSLEFPFHFYVVSLAANENGDVFFILNMDEATPDVGGSVSFCKKTKLAYYDDEKKTAETLHVFDDWGRSHWPDVGELAACNDALYWVCKDMDGRRIERYDLATGIISTQKPVHTSPGITLTASGDFVTWLEKTDGGRKHILYALNSISGEIQTVSENVSSRQARAYVSNGLTSYIDASPEPQIVIYNMYTEAVVSSFSPETERIVSNPTASKDYVIWEESAPSGSSDKSYMLYDFRQGMTFSLDFHDAISSVVSVHLLDDLIVVNNSIFLTAEEIQKINEEENIFWEPSHEGFLSFAYLADDTFVPDIVRYLFGLYVCCTNDGKSLYAISASKMPASYDDQLTATIDFFRLTF